MPSLSIGCAGHGALHHDGLPLPSAQESFALVKDTGAFDHYDKFPEPAQWDAHARASDHHRLPILAGTTGYVIGRDDDTLVSNLARAHTLGSRIHNIALYKHDASGRHVTDDEVAGFYLKAFDAAGARGIDPAMEAHIDMWSEDFRRVDIVAAKVQARGVPFNLTLDCSHVLFKVDNPQELEISGIREAVAAGEIVIDPFRPGNVFDRWLDAGLVRHVHARSAAFNGPPNRQYSFTDGSHGRGIQYPFIEPAPGQWHHAWDEAALEPFKEVMRKVLVDHLSNPASRIDMITTEFIARPHYGAGARYSMLDNNAACARWLRDERDRLSLARQPSARMS